MSIGKEIIDGLKELNNKLKNNKPIQVTQVIKKPNGKIVRKKKIL